MKKTVLLSMFLMMTLQGADKIASLESDDSIATSQRKSILALSDLGLESTQSKLPIIFCSQRNVCLPIGNYTIRLNQQRVNTILKAQYPFLISARYDKVIIESDKMRISTPTQNFEQPLEDGTAFSFNGGDETLYQLNVLNYLNEKIAPYFLKILDRSKEARFKQMEADQVETFINTQAKELGISAPALKVLMESSYAFALYLPKIRGKIVTIQYQKRRQNQVFYSYSTSLDAPVNTKLLIFKFNGEKFIYKKSVGSDVEGFNIGESLAKKASGSGTIVSPVRPRISDSQRLFDQIFYTSFKDSLLTIATRLKEDRIFSLQAPINNIEANTFHTTLGVQEGVRVGAPFDVLSTDFEGNENKIAWARIRSVGLNCLKLPAQDRTQSEGKLIKGKAEEMDLLVERPYSGVYFGARYAKTEKTIETATATIRDINNIDLYFEADMGYITNASALYNVWNKFIFGYGWNQTSGSLGSGFALTFGYQFQKRFDLFKGIFMGLGAELDLEYYYNDFRYTSGGLDTLLFSLKPLATLGYYINPNLELHATVAYDYSFYSFSEVYNNNYVAAPSVTINENVSAMIGFSYHLDLSGPFTSQVTAPSRECDTVTAE